jgi:hypothetical protein
MAEALVSAQALSSTLANSEMADGGWVAERVVR